MMGSLRSPADRAGFDGIEWLSGVGVLALALIAACTAHAGELVRIENASRPTQCAEEDNVYVKFVGAGVRHLTIEARHPAYLPTLTADSMAPDFTHCDQSHDPSYAFAPRDVTLYEDPDYALVGHAFASFWRPESVDFRVGETVTRGLHLVQLIRKTGGRRIEILVVYPSDGYWRVKPLPPPGFAETGYGSSFLVGPIAEDGRPYVPIRSIAFAPDTLTFRLRFDNGEGAVRVVRAAAEGTRLEIAIPPSPAPSNFAALRSMYVSPNVADAAEATLTGAAGAPDRRPILDFPATQIEAAAFSRSAPSRHNASAPDLLFGDFTR